MGYRRTKIRKKTFLFIPYGDETYHPECAEHSRDQVETGDGADHYSPTGGKSRIDIYVDDRQKDKSKLNFSLGVNTVIENLQKGRAVMAGVMYNPDKNTGNYNKATNHFITIVGMGEDETGIYFSYYDNYSDGQGEKIGTDLEENRLYYNMDSSNPMFKDVTNVPLDAGKKDRTATYTLTEVRNNVDD